jgi:putative phosphoribosyl transferase
MHFHDRHEAGRLLARKLMRYRDLPDVRVLALPRGGVPVGFEVAEALQAPLDVFLVRKLGLPGREELAMGAIASGDVLVLNPDVVDRLAIPRSTIEVVAERERRELERQQALYLHDRPPTDVRGCTIILVDDGLATGSTMRAAVEALRQLHPRWIVAAVPVGAAETCTDFADVADEVVCAASPEQFFSVGAWYADFSPTTDEEVATLLESADRRFAAGVASPH